MRTPPRLVLRAEGGPGIGSGHVARCFALAQAWVDAGGRAELVSYSLSDGWARRWWDEGMTVRDPEDVPFGEEAADWVVFDGYHFEVAGQEAARSGGARVLVVDDHGMLGAHAADAILDQNLDASAAPYEKSGAADLFLGTRYALLRREFARWRDWERTVAARADRLLVSWGGSPAPEARALLERTLVHPALAALEPVILQGDVDVPRAMAEADLALAAAGTTSWELCHMRLPAVVVAAADNQVPLAAALARHGVAENSGWLLDARPEDLAEAVAALAADPERRRSMAAAGAALVDGRGARRVVTVLRARLLRLRQADEGDERLLWEWANDPVVRAFSFSSDPIPLEEHRAWMAHRLADPACRIYVASDGNDAPLGQARFDHRRDEPIPEIGVSVAAGRRGEGWGAALVEAAVRRFFADTAAPALVARIKPHNRASACAFEDAGFVAEGVRSEGGHTWLRYTRSRDGGPPG